MKYRLIALIIFLSLALVSCSLAEDITPPPGYQSLSSGQTIATMTPTPQETQTTVPTTIKSEASPVNPQASTQSTEVTQTPVAFRGNITGNLVNGSGGTIPKRSEGDAGGV